MAHYKINYLIPPNVKGRRKSKRHSVTTWIASIAFFAFALLSFGGIGTAFRYRGQHLTLRQEHDALRLRYDSLYGAKLHSDKQLMALRRKLELLQKQP